MARALGWQLHLPISRRAERYWIGGDGAFLNFLIQKNENSFETVLFEPYMGTVSGDRLICKTSWDDVVFSANVRPFDVVFCQEVLEHFSPARQNEALARIASIMAHNGRLILSVPVEIGPETLIKNMARWKYRKASKDICSYRNLLKSLIGRTIHEARSGDDYLSHMGFYYSDLRALLLGHFVIERTMGSPLIHLPLLANSQVFFVCRLRQGSTGAK